MKIYNITIEYRKGRASSLGLFTTFEAAVAALKNEVGNKNDEYGGNLDLGTYYTTEKTYEIIAQELQ